MRVGVLVFFVALIVGCIDVPDHVTIKVELPDGGVHVHVHAHDASIDVEHEVLPWE